VSEPRTREPRISASPEPKFKIGQVVQHLRFAYRGVVHDLHETFGQSDEWYEQVARSRPPKDKPWYCVLVNGGEHETYVAERHLEADTSGEPIKNPQLDDYFDEFRGDHYARTQNLN